MPFVIKLIGRVDGAPSPADGRYVTGIIGQAAGPVIFHCRRKTDAFKLANLTAALAFNKTPELAAYEREIVEIE